MSWRIAGLLLGTVILLSYVPDATTQAQGQQPELSDLVHMDVSPPLRDMVPLPPDPLRDEAHPAKPLPLRQARRALTTLDPALQMSVPAPATPSPMLNFDGVGVGLGSYDPNVAPPDTNGAVGATQYVQWVNLDFAVFDKSTGDVVYGPAAGNTLWQGFGGDCETHNNGDPIALYDEAANRWIMSQLAITVNTGPFFQCIAVSTSSDATGTWRRFAYQQPSFNDYPKVGVWPDAYYITYNMFNAAGTAFLGARVCAYDRSQILTPSGVPGPEQCFQLSDAYGGLLPADLDGWRPPPAGSPNYVLAFDDLGLDGLNLWKFHVDWATPASSTFTGPAKILTDPFTVACPPFGRVCIPQPGTAQQLDSLGDRLMYRLAYRNFGDHESLVVNHSVDVSGHSGVRWYEIRNPGGVTPTVFQQSTFSPDTNHRWMGSIAMDGAGNMLLGYSTSGSVKPSVRVTGRLAGDVLNTMQAEIEMIPGGGVQTTGLSRWGDYSAMAIDVDDCTLWYTQEYLKSNGTFNWSTRIGTFKFPGCASGGKFFTLTPCRVADTRNPPGPSGGPDLQANTTRSFPAAGLCGIPTDARAIALNVTVFRETDFGNLRLYPTGGPPPGSSTINFVANKVRANNAIIPLGTDGEISVQCDMPPDSTGSTGFLFDVYGYFK